MLELKTITIGEFEFDYWLTGDKNNELIIFLHGFPETSIIWSRLMNSISALGFYCVAPNMRGYSKGACPKGIKNYSFKKLSADILSIADALAKDRLHLIAHDLGATIGWDIVYNNPKRIISWTALSAPHNRAFFEALKTDKVQKKKSNYAKFILLPIIPEIIMRRNDFKWLRRVWKNSSPEEVDYHLTIFRRKSSLTGALNYYRANLRDKSYTIGYIDTPTLYIWGKKDTAVGEIAAKGTAQYMKGDFTFLELLGGHWLIQTNYIEVESATKKHLLKYKIDTDSINNGVEFR